MEPQSALLAVWYEGAKIATLSCLLEQSPDQIEDHLRKELHKLRDDAAAPAPLVAIAPPVTRRNAMPLRESTAPPAKPKPAAGQALRQKMAEACDAKRAKSVTKTAPVSLVKSEAGLGPEELRGYPIMMRRVNSEGLRKVYQALKAGPKTIDEMVEKLGVSYDMAWQACTKMFAAGLASKTDERPFRWRLIERPADSATGD